MSQFYDDEDMRAWQRAQGITGPASNAAAPAREHSKEPSGLPATESEKAIFFRRKLRLLLAAGERRQLHLQKKLDQRLGSPGALEFDRAELAFVSMGLAALLYYRAQERMGGDGLIILSRLVKETRKAESLQDDDLIEVLEAAEKLLGLSEL